MAEEPSWEDIFNPNPTPREPEAAPPAPLVEPPQAYPPTQAYPAQPAAAQDAPAGGGQQYPPQQPGQVTPPLPGQVAPPPQAAPVYPPQSAPGYPQPDYPQPDYPQQQQPPAAPVRFPEQEFAREFPVQPAPAPQAAPAEDPFAGLFPPAQQPAAPVQAVPVQPGAVQQPPAPAPAAEEDPFAALFATPPAPQEPAAPQQYAAPPQQAVQPAEQEFLAPPSAPAQPEQYAPTQQYPPVQSAPPAQQAFPAAQSYPAPAYPPTEAYPAAESQAPAPAAPVDPLAGLFGGTPAQAGAQAPAQPAPADDPFAGLFGTPQPPAAEPASGYTPEAPFPATAAARFTPRDEDDPFAALFGDSAAPAAVASSGGRDVAQGRRGADGSGSTAFGDDQFAGGSGGRGRSGGGSGSGSGNGKPRKRRRLLWLKITLPILLVLALVGGAGAYGWFNYNEQVRALLGIPLPTDYTGNGNGKEVIITIHSGDIGEDIAHTLHDKGVTLTFDAFYDLLLAQKEQPSFVPGNFALQQHMSAKAALKALLDPANKVTDKLLITEGTTLPDALQTIADTTGIKLEDLQAASQDLAGLGVPTTEHTLEGWLFPATYTLDGGQTAHDVLQLLVNTMIEHLDSAGVPVDQRHNVLTLASIIQRESGPNTDDFYKISRVFTNRMEQGINLESDATVAYGTGHLNTVYTTDAERADATNPYNTYANPGLPVGPIGLPGDTAIDAALHPVDGPWLFFVPINLQTGETVFSETVEEHDAAVEQLQEWCAASPENDSYCQ